MCEGKKQSGLIVVVLNMYFIKSSGSREKVYFIIAFSLSVLYILYVLLCIPLIN